MEKKKRGRPTGKMPVPIQRKCVICKEVHLINKFDRSKSHPGGHTYICKMCNTILARTRYIKKRLMKHGYQKILNEIDDLRAGIQLRWAILDENKNKI